MTARRELAILVVISSLLLATCDQRSVPPTPTSASETATTTPQPTLTLRPPAPPTPRPYPPLTRTPAPSRTPTSTLTPSPIPSSTPTYPPYLDIPFSIVFLRDGNLWLAEVGGSGERQLTAESNEWPVSGFAVSPDGAWVAYTIYKAPPSMDALIKLVQISTGQVSVLTGENDQCSEYSVKWLDATHLAFRVSEHAVEEHSDRSCFPDSDPLMAHVILDLATGERTSVSALHLSQSPNGRYWLTCSSCTAGYAYECSCQYVLQDRVTGQDLPVAESLEWPSFGGWSPDGHLMLFAGMESDRDPPVRPLVIVDAATQETWKIVPEDQTIGSAAWSPDGQTLAFIQCNPCGPETSLPCSRTCTLWLADQRGDNPQRIPVDIPLAYAGPAMCLAWTPEGSRLVFARAGPVLNTHTIWTVRVDGTDLQPIVVDAYHVCYEMRHQP
jgi:WD40 repeat protein